MKLQSQIIITTQFEETIAKLRQLAQRDETFVPIVREGNFLVDDVKLAIEKAYLASQERTIIILAADNFSEVVQNRLLKIIEEPPPNKEFILLFPSKAIILPTIKSRLPITVLEELSIAVETGLDMGHLDIRAVYDFVQEHARISAPKAKELLEQISTEAIRAQRYHLDEITLNLMRDAVKVLDRGSPPAFVLTGVLLKLLARKKR
jgi:DNA polymerase-3 subunit delta'